MNAPGPRGADLLSRATAALAQAGIPDAGRDARRLLAHALRVPPGRLTLFLPELVAPDRAAAFDALIAHRRERVPVSHLTGRRLFYGREFLVTPDVLDPRPETETLIEVALAEPFASVLDLGTGSGCILLTLLAERETAVGIGTDISDAALEVAFWNRNALRLEQRAELRAGSWYAPLSESGDPDEPVDLIVANPPYVALHELPFLDPDVRAHEPRQALTDEADGLSAYRAILAGFGSHLAAGGRLAVETGATQGASVSRLFAKAGLASVRVVPDIAGRDRVVVGSRGVG